MRIVNLVSGGMDSTLIGVLSREEGHEVFPLFLDYGQRAAQREWTTCQRVHSELGLPTPSRMDLSGFGRVILTGLTCQKLDVKKDAFTPGRNLMFLVMAGSYAIQVGATRIAIGLLDEKFSLFPDQTSDFLLKAEIAIQAAMGIPINVVAPLSDFTKVDVIHLAELKGIHNTYSCHVGDETPCGLCISCLEFSGIIGG